MRISKWLNRSKWLALVPVVPTAVGCMTYAPQQLSAMSSYELCETELVYRVNLSKDSRQLLRTELERRKEDCSSQRSAIKAAQAEVLYKRTYDTVSP